jgi:GT2 family glycosyltransferase
MAESGGMAVDVGVVIVAYNSADVIGVLLDSIESAASGLRVATVVVDNGSEDGTVALIRAREDCTLIPSANNGYAGGINLGVASLPPCQAVLVLNPDIRLHPGAVIEMYDALSAPSAGVVAPQVLDQEGNLTFSLRREPSLGRALGLTRTRRPAFSEYVQEAEVYQRSGTHDWALGAALMIDSRCFEALGGWDSTYFLYSEETDFCLRARDRGYETRFAPTAQVTHIGGASGRSELTHTMMVLNRVRLYRRRHNLCASWMYFSLTVLSEMSWVARPGRRRSWSWAAIRALLLPGLRPTELRLSGRVMPR